MDLTNDQISILKDMMDDFSDKLRHYPDAEMGWDADDVAVFEDLSDLIHAEAKARGFWWAR